jgi:regulator of sigma E protease
VFDTLLDVVIFLALVTVLVLLHELGHFIVARRAGVTVHEFGIGFPPRAAVLFRRGDTVYTLNWLPIGGFVRMEGEIASPAEGGQARTEAGAAAQTGSELHTTGRADELESLDPHAFVNQGLGTRLRILLAGAAVNLVLAWLIFTVIALVAEPIWRVRIDEVVPGSPAAAAGLHGGSVTGTGERSVVDPTTGEPTGQVIPYKTYDDSGDVIVAIDGHAFPVFDDFARSDGQSGIDIGLTTYLSEHPGQTVTLTVEHADGTREDVQVTLRSAAEIAANQGALGIVYEYPPAYGSQQNGLVDAVVTGAEMTVQTSTLILRALGTIVVGIFSGTGEGLGQVSGPVGMVSVIGTVRTALPPVFLLWFVGIISANLGIINLLPIPPLDGSRMAMGLVQAASGGRITPATERLVYLTGWVALMLFLVVVTFSDIQRLMP